MTTTLHKSLIVYNGFSEQYKRFMTLPAGHAREYQGSNFTLENLINYWNATFVFISPSVSNLWYRMLRIIKYSLYYYFDSMLFSVDNSALESKREWYATDMKSNIAIYSTWFLYQNKHKHKAVYRLYDMIVLYLTKICNTVVNTLLING